MRVVVVGGGIRFSKRWIFQSLDAEFAEDSVTALVGPSGSGKSSLLAAIAGFASLAVGQVWHDDHGVRRSANPSNVTWLAQDANLLLARSVLDNVMLGPLSERAPLSVARETARRALLDVGMASQQTTPCRLLSGGERQRVAFARSLASDRRLILADEPSSSLDEANTRQVATLLRRMSGRGTVIVATHDPVVIAAADAIVSIRHTTA